MTSSEWAAWVQAVGTIVAVGAAWWLSDRQHRRDKNRELDTAREKSKQVAKLCIVFNVHLLQTIAELRRGCDFQNAEIVSRQTHRLRDVVAFAQAIDVSTIPAEAVDAFMDLRRIAAEAVRDAEYMESVKFTTGWQHWSGRFEQLREQVHRSSIELGAALGTPAALAAAREDSLDREAPATR